MARHRTFADINDPMFTVCYGGPGGSRFDDRIVGGDRVRALWLAAGRLVDSIQVAYRDGHRTSRHGGTGGAGHWTAFEPDELILGIGGRYGELVERLVIRTTHRTLSGGGQAGPGKPFTLLAPDGYHIIGFHGGSGVYLDRIGACFAPLPLPAHRPAERARAELSRMAKVGFEPFCGDDPASSA